MAQTVSKIFASHKITAYTQGSLASAVDIGWVDMQDYENFAALGLATALTGIGLTTFKILGNTSSTGAGTDVLIKTHAIGSAPDAVGDYLVLECTVEEMASAGADLRYLSVSAVAANAADRVAFFYVRTGGIGKAGSTADVVA